MVGRRAGAERFRAARGFLRAVGIREDAVAQHPEAGRHEDVVDVAEGLAVGIEAVLRAGPGVFDLRQVERVVQQPRVVEHGVALARLADVEIAREHGAFAAAHRADLVERQPAALGLRTLAFVVGVQREEPETLLGLAVEETPPAADADILGVPAPVRARGLLGEPEMARVEQFETLTLVKHDGVFARLGAVVTPDARVAVTRQRP